MNTRAAALALYLTACGRIAFDPSTNESASGDGAIGDGVQMQGDALIDDAATDDALFTCGAVSCTGGTFSMCNGRCFAHCPVLATQDVASTSCVNWGGTLLVLQNAADLACAVALNPSTPRWLGYMQAMTASTTGEQWIWLDSVQIWPAAPWATGDPNDGDMVENGGEQCAILFADSTAADVSCMSLNHYMCSR